MPLRVLTATLAAAALVLLLRPGLAHAGGDLVLYTWTQNIVPDLLARFEKETGIKVTTDTYLDDEGLLANVEAGTAHYDVVTPDDYMVKILIDKGLLQPIDAAAMPNFRNVRKPFDRPWFDPQRRYSAPSMWGTTGIAYDSAQADGGRLEDSWKEFFEPRPAMAGKIIASSDPAQLYPAAAYYLGIDPCTEDPKDGERILELLLAQKPKVAFYGANDGSPEWAKDVLDGARAGKLAMAQDYDNGVRAFQRLLPSIAYIVPREGSTLWQDSFAVPYGALHPENARIFIDWIMAPKNIAELSEATGATNSIAGSEAYMSAALARDQIEGLTPERQQRFRDRKACSPAARDLSQRVWAKLWPLTVK